MLTNTPVNRHFNNEENTLLSKLRDPISAISHLSGAAAALAGLLALLRSPNDQLGWTISLVVYGLSLFLLFLASGMYHAINTTPRITQILRRLDHSAIYLLIAGTYTPFCVMAFSGFWKWGLLAIIWGLAAAGIVAKVFFIHTPRWATAGVYVVMGWLSVFAIREILAALPGETIGWILAGGIIYTLGAAVYVTRRLDFVPGKFGFHEVWHFFVLLGALSHFIAVYSLL